MKLEYELDTFVGFNLNALRNNIVFTTINDLFTIVLKILHYRI